METLLAYKCKYGYIEDKEFKCKREDARKQDAINNPRQVIIRRCPPDVRRIDGLPVCYEKQRRK